MYNTSTCEFGLLLLNFNNLNTYKCKKNLTLNLSTTYN